MPARRPVRFGAVVDLGLIVGLIASLCAGCGGAGQDGTQEGSMAAENGSSSQPIPAVDAETARGSVRADLDQVEQLLRPVRFEVVDEGGAAEVPLTCPLPDGGYGRSYGFKGRTATTEVGDPAGKAKLVADHWRGKGYQVKERSEIAYEVTARTTEGGALSFIVGLKGQGMSLGGESACAPAGQ